jgi:hypothetical protein
MSRKNTTETSTLPNGKVRVHFETNAGIHVYEYSAASGKKILAGRDPSDFDAKLIEIKKAK